MLVFFLLQLILGVDMIFYFFHFVFPPPEEISTYTDTCTKIYITPGAVNNTKQNMKLFDSTS